MAKIGEPFPSWAQRHFAEDDLDRSRRDRLYEALRGAILSGDYPPGNRLPPTRSLAKHLGIARNTVLDAYERLTAEGFVIGSARRGTTVVTDVAPTIGCAPQSATTDTATFTPSHYTQRALSALALYPAGIAGVIPARPFRPGVPALLDFPMRRWRSLLA